MRASVGPAHDLTVSLLRRDAIPHVRLRYFNDPALNIGSKRSREQVFEANGRHGENIFKDPNFFKYLRYFVLGPDLPETTIGEFQALLKRVGPISSGDVFTMVEFVRLKARESELDRGACAEEFFKLALECGLGVGDGRAMRDAVMRLSRK